MKRTEVLIVPLRGYEGGFGISLGYWVTKGPQQEILLIG